MRISSCEIAPQPSFPKTEQPLGQNFAQKAHICYFKEVIHFACDKWWTQLKQALGNVLNVTLNNKELGGRTFGLGYNTLGFPQQRY